MKHRVMQVTTYLARAHRRATSSSMSSAEADTTIPMGLHQVGPLFDGEAFELVAKPKWVVLEAN